MEPIEGGQSGTAPSCAEGQTRVADAESAATATEAVGGTSSLSVEVSLPDLILACCGTLTDTDQSHQR
jgi:hypothetical protein